MSEQIVSNTPAPSDTGATPVPASGTPAAATPATPNVAPQPNAISGAPEDRSNWVPPHRVRETREAAIRQAQQEFAVKEAALQAQLSQYQKNLQALTGVQPPQNPEIDQVKQQFSKLYPDLARMEGRYGDFEKLLNKIQELEDQNTHYWGNHAQSTVDRLYSVAEEALGSPMSPDAKHQLYASFVGYLQANPEAAERYKTDAGPLVKDFWKAFSASFIDPYRRAATVADAGRIPAGLPQDTPGGAPQSTPAPKLTNLEDRAKAAWQTFNSRRTQTT